MTVHLDHYIGSHVDDAAANAFIASNGWTARGGLLYLNSTDGSLYIWDGGAWVQIGGGALSFPGISAANLLFVDKGSNVPEDGSAQNPYHAMQSAINAAAGLGLTATNPGAVLVYGGEYDEQLTHNVQYLSVIGIGQEAVHVKNDASPVVTVSVGNAVVQGISIIAGDAGAKAVSVTATTATVTFRDCFVEGRGDLAGSDGFGVDGDANVILDRCTVTARAATGDALEINTNYDGGFEARQCTFYGAFCRIMGTGNAEAIFTDCVFHNSALSSDSQPVIDCASGQSMKVYFERCSLRTSTGGTHAIFITSYIADIRVNCCSVISSGAGLAAIYIGRATNTIELTNNYLEGGSGSPDVIAALASTVTVRGNSTTNGLQSTIVSADSALFCGGGTDSYETITAAVTAAASKVPSATNPVVVYLRDGYYNEQFTLGTGYISLIGESLESVRISSDQDPVVTISQANILMQGISVYANQVGSNAALLLSGSADDIVLRDCLFHGYGDVSNDCAIRITAGATVDIDRCVLELEDVDSEYPSLHLDSGAPDVTMRQCEIRHGIVDLSGDPGTRLTLYDTVIGPYARIDVRNLASQELYIERCNLQTTEDDCIEWSSGTAGVLEIRNSYLKTTEANSYALDLTTTQVSVELLGNYFESGTNLTADIRATNPTTVLVQGNTFSKGMAGTIVSSDSTLFVGSGLDNYEDISAAINAASNKTPSSTNPVVVYIRSGYYAETFTTASDWVSFVGEERDSTIIYNNAYSTLLTLQNDNVVFANLTLYGARPGEGGTACIATGAALPDGVRFYNVLVKYTGGSPNPALVSIAHASDGLVFDRCEFDGGTTENVDVSAGSATDVHAYYDCKFHGVLDVGSVSVRLMGCYFDLSTSAAAVDMDNTNSAKILEMVGCVVFNASSGGGVVLPTTASCEAYLVGNVFACPGAAVDATSDMAGTSAVYLNGNYMEQGMTAAVIQAGQQRNVGGYYDCYYDLDNAMNNAPSSDEVKITLWDDVTLNSPGVTLGQDEQFVIDGQQAFTITRAAGAPAFTMGIDSKLTLVDVLQMTGEVVVAQNGAEFRLVRSRMDGRIEATGGDTTTTVSVEDSIIIGDATGQYCIYINDEDPLIRIFRSYLKGDTGDAAIYWGAVSNLDVKIAYSVIMHGSLGANNPYGQVGAEQLEVASHHSAFNTDPYAGDWSNLIAVADAEDTYDAEADYPWFQVA